MRVREQDAVLAEAARYVKPGGGRLVYVTCSLLVEENDARIAAFCAANPDFKIELAPLVASAAGMSALAAHADQSDIGLHLSPLRTGTDGFFVATLRRG